MAAPAIVEAAPDQFFGIPCPMRPSGRDASVLRTVSLEPGFARHAEGSCLIRMGQTEVLCTASVEGKVPPFLRGQGQGWVTAEYGMLPRATHTRGDREAARGKQSGRTQEIQRLIGRSLRAVTDMKAMGEMSVLIDCDVLTADGGTRCASITGAWVALHLAFEHCRKMNIMSRNPLKDQVAAVSCGVTSPLRLIQSSSRAGRGSNRTPGNATCCAARPGRCCSTAPGRRARAPSPPASRSTRRCISRSRWS